MWPVSNRLKWTVLAHTAIICAKLTERHQLQINFVLQLTCLFPQLCTKNNNEYSIRKVSLQNERKTCGRLLAVPALISITSPYTIYDRPTADVVQQKYGIYRPVFSFYITWQKEIAMKQELETDGDTVEWCQKSALQQKTEANYQLTVSKQWPASLRAIQSVICLSVIYYYRILLLTIHLRFYCSFLSTQLNSTGYVTLMAKRDQKKGKKATAYQYPLSLI